ncbi:MAG: glycosyltransferase family 4 protein [Caldilineales bacterium]|nr:glycosyltransferase family 4 protein [Caldilineales bacterium]MDW8318585.1 glycosyltransferase family 4 protein [Anaerolineae bacterium]
MRVALLCHYPDDETAPAGGVWAVGRNLAAGLTAAGAEVHVVRYVAVAGSGPARLATTGCPPLTVHTVEIPRSRRYPVRRLAAVPALAAALAEIRPDAVTAHESEYGLAALRSGFPTAVTIHGIPRREFWAFRTLRNRLDLAVTVWQDELLARRVRHIVAIADYVVAQYRGRTKAQFHRIDVPIGDVFFAAPERSPDPRTLLLVGGMNERKDPMTLLAALRLLVGEPDLADLELRIAGRVSETGFGARLRRTIADYGLAERVCFLGSLDQPALAQAYAASALTVLSSRQETSPAVLMEAMAARRPVVATDVGGVREIVEHGGSGLVVPPGDPPALAAAIAEVLRRPDSGAAMGQRGRALAEARYRRARVGRQYLELLQRLAESQDDRTF